jgi:DNA-binding CsgD family transcriptional regulator
MKEKELASQSIHLQSIKAFSDTMTTKLKQFKKGLPDRSEEELSKLISEFEHRFPEALWEDFQMRFEKINDSFYQKLMEKCPDLTPVEIKLAGLLRLNLSTKEISDLTNRSIGTIANTRSTLRKKLQLENDDNLVSYLISL